MADDFDALPHALQLQVDAAFDTARTSHSSNRPSPKKRRKLESASNPEPAGGFIIEDDEGPGGFILPSEDEEGSHKDADDLIPFSLIPTALQILDLPPDDPEVLQVFRNAASGWSSVVAADDADGEGELEGGGGTVSRKDWRAVCAVVVGNREEDIEAEGNHAGGFIIEDERATGSGVEHSPQQDDDDEGEGEGEAEEEYDYEDSMSSFSDDQDADSDSDEYLAGPSTSKSKTKARGNKSKRHHRPSPAPDGPTPRQKRAALEAYALFFPSTTPLSDDDLIMKRLMFKDIVRVSEILKEKIKADEITEMLSLFSTAPDKSISFDDFARMMIMAKLAWWDSPLLAQIFWQFGLCFAVF